VAQALVILVHFSILFDVQVGGSVENKSIGNGAADFASATADVEEGKDMVSAIRSTL
jgi:hypothetical protein